MALLLPFFFGIVCVCRVFPSVGVAASGVQAAQHCQPEPRAEPEHMEKAPSSETANAGDAAKSAAITKTSRRMIQSNSESKSQSRSTSQSQSLSQKSQSRSRRQSQNQSYSESRSGIVDGKMRAAEQRMIWKSGQKMIMIVPMTADYEKAGDALHRQGA